MNCAQLKNREGASELDNGTDGDMRLENQWSYDLWSKCLRMTTNNIMPLKK
jgi:hypothetical protein